MRQTTTPISTERSGSLPTKLLRPWRALVGGLFAGLGALALSACSRPSPSSAHQAKNAPSAPAPSPQARIVERSASALSRMRDNPRFKKMDSYLANARAVMIFPRVIKASLIVGGEGGNGVMVVRKPDGSWSSPAFYSLGAPSIGLQAGYQETSVVLFIMDDATLDRAYGSSLTLGTQAGVALGDVLEPGGTAGRAIAPKIYQVVESGGVFAGVSLDGYVIESRESHNAAYYGSDASVRTILSDSEPTRAENIALDAALAGG
jgi:lipid-binding SYLF domain-containing protein